MALRSKAAVFKKLPSRLLLYLVIGALLLGPMRNTLAHHFLYFPDPQHIATPADAGLAYETISFVAADGTLLNGWLVPGQPDAPVVLFCMGNAGNISHRLETLQLLHHLGVATFIFDYRGYGRSTGTTTETGTYQDILGALDVLGARGWDPGRIIIFGRSLGAAIGLQGALNKPPAGLILESAFTSIAAMGRYHYPLLNLLLGWLIDAKYDNLAKIGTLASPLLLIHGRKDAICPPFMAEQLYAAAPAVKQIFWIENADHNNGFVVGGADYQQVLAAAIKDWTGFSR